MIDKTVRDICMKNKDAASRASQHLQLIFSEPSSTFLHFRYEGLQKNPKKTMQKSEVNQQTFRSLE